MNFKIFFLILSTQFLFAQEKPIVFENNAKAYSNKNFDEFSNERSFCDLTISQDSTFSFYSRPHLSCYTWNEIKGKWKKEKNIYTFLSEYQVTENDTRLTFAKDSTKKYLLKFATDKKSTLKNRSIKIVYMYDFYAEIKIDDIEKIMSFNQDNSIEIPFDEIPNHEKLASFRIEYFLSASEKRYQYITESKMVNVKERDIPNIVEIEFVEQPKKEMVYRTTIGKLEGDKLEIVSSVKTKPSLPEYLTEIGFEKYYELRK
ncbi:hypothetical protein [Flavobacterium aquatile]|uniref:Uncharacterized protein n=1 Tax=Flavobacterium aquatile LMG 4008 = ATCC 11947 TaxID=1453498 RepID=A0A095SYK1_9FLAO|nr:hypothetical protein [Flavobacterium aquatile]KGD69602.1 hypothetical protein LG45_02265 [Flavobacterium aquatile LMG 4008 = ATCC 11947]OXA67259.1 hypothetical protein B0A61_08615 [Flavobacterium aquatile LMG 4008 = ATCC 11947]GEC77917.1 hypothetical protein FAQ01_07870 [Flavobacterium aquatile]